jgi:hypothetical protein
MYFHTDKTYVDYIRVNPYSRCGRRRKFRRGLGLHWTANPGTDDKANRDYFDSLADSKETYASAQWIVGFERITQTMPDDEEAFHVGATHYTEAGKRLCDGCDTPNQSLLGIEVCCKDDSGIPSDSTYQLLVSLCAEKLTSDGLTPESMFLHGEVVLDDVGTYLKPRDCHTYWMRNPEAWKTLKADVGALMNQNASHILTWKEQAVKGLLDRGRITSPDWINQADGSVPLWALAVILNRMDDSADKRMAELQRELDKLRAK